MENIQIIILKEEKINYINRVFYRKNRAAEK